MFWNYGYDLSFFYRFTFEENNEARHILATAQNFNDFRQVCMKIKEKYLPYHEGKIQYECDTHHTLTRQEFSLILPPWICQPYVRMSPEEHTKKMENLCTNQVIRPRKRHSFN